MTFWACFALTIVLVGAALTARKTLADRSIIDVHDRDTVKSLYHGWRNVGGRGARGGRGGRAGRGRGRPTAR